MLFTILFMSLTQVSVGKYITCEESNLLVTISVAMGAPGDNGLKWWSIMQALPLPQTRSLYKLTTLRVTTASCNCYAISWSHIRCRSAVLHRMWKWYVLRSRTHVCWRHLSMWFQRETHQIYCGLGILSMRLCRPVSFSCGLIRLQYFEYVPT